MDNYFYLIISPSKSLEHQVLESGLEGMVPKKEQVRALQLLGSVQNHLHDITKVRFSQGFTLWIEVSALEHAEQQLDGTSIVPMGSAEEHI